MSTMTRALALALPLAVAVAAPSLAQQPAPKPGTSSSSSQVLPEVDSILRHRAWHHEFTPGNQQAGFRNPGNVGRVNEYYPPGDRFQGAAQPHITARIGLGGVPDRNEQLAAYNAGTARYNAIQTHIDRYGRPMMGFGMGFGFGW
jgi:hypothetical protein